MQTEKLVTCPFNISYKMHATKLDQHLQSACKERKQLEETKKKCLYNPHHQLPEVMLDYHLMSCPDKNKERQAK